MAVKEMKMDMEPIVTRSRSRIQEAKGVTVISPMSSNIIVWRSLSAWVRMEMRYTWRSGLSMPEPLDQYQKKFLAILIKSTIE